MRTAFVALLGVLLTQQEPWTPFNDPTNKHHPERALAIDVEHYDIRITIDDKRPGEIDGEVAVTLAPLAETSRIELDAADMTVRSVTCEKFPTMFQQKDETLAIDTKGAVGKGEKITLTIAYSAKPKHGMFWVAPDAGYPDKHWMVWTQGETDYNHHWFPCWDFPNDRATWDLRATYPSKYTSISNGALASSTEKDGRRTDQWRQEVPTVTYLVSLIVGDFEKVEDTLELGDRKVPVQYFVPRGLHTEEEIRRTFGRTPAMIKFFSEKTGLPYAYPKYAQTVVHDFIWGGMENVSATTLHGYTVIAKRSWDDRDSDGLIAHELAHQWFGDYVTCRDWAHIWLNESFATYFEALWQESVAGPDALADDLAGGAGWYFGQEKEYSRPIVCDVYSDPDDVFDACAYPKGAWVLHMLRKTIGDEA
jgi:aminopeptidase N